MHRLYHYPTPAVLAEAGAALFARCAHEAIRARGRFSVALAGGSTPRPLYARLAHPPYPSDVDWGRVHVFFGDERCVPPGHPHSNYRMAAAAMLDVLSLPPENIHRIRGEAPPQQAAAEYEAALRAFFGAQPRFDLVLLGLGMDGHTASLFPGSAALEEQERWAAASYAPAQHAWRVTLTYPALNAARTAAFLVSGEAKRPILEAVLRGGGETRYPAQGIRPEAGELLWLVSP